MRHNLLYNFVLIFLTSLVLLSCKTGQKTAGVSTENETRSLLWKIEGKESKSSYLFGTIHLIDEDKYFFTSDMQAAFDSSELLALEFDVEEAMNVGAQLGLLQKAFMRNDTTLSDLISEEDYKKVQDHFQEMGIPLFLFERVKPMFLTIFASDNMFSSGSMEDIKSYELELIDMSKERNLPVEGLETMEYQISIFDSIPYRAQADMLVASLDAADSGTESMDTLIHYYRQQNLQMLDALINADPTTQKYKGLLLDNRNRNWIPVIEELIHRSPTFIAVGAGHLSGEFGVINLLRKEGYTVIPINTQPGGSD